MRWWRTPGLGSGWAGLGSVGLGWPGQARSDFLGDARCWPLTGELEELAGSPLLPSIRQAHPGRDPLRTPMAQSGTPRRRRSPLPE